MDEMARAVDTTHEPRPPCVASTSSNSTISHGSHHSFEITSPMRYSLVSIVSKSTRRSLPYCNASSIPNKAERLWTCAQVEVGHGWIFRKGSHPANRQEIPRPC